MTRPPKQAAIIFLIGLLALPVFASAATSTKKASPSSAASAATSSNPFIDTNALNQAKQNLENIGRTGQRASGFFGGIGRVWDDINNWLKKNIGLSFKDVILFFFTILLWVLGFVIKALEALVRVIQFVLSYIQ